MVNLAAFAAFEHHRGAAAGAVVGTAEDDVESRRYIVAEKGAEVRKSVAHVMAECKYPDVADRACHKPGVYHVWQAGDNDTQSGQYWERYSWQVPGHQQDWNDENGKYRNDEQTRAERTEKGQHRVITADRTVKNLALMRAFQSLFFDLPVSPASAAETSSRPYIFNEELLFSRVLFAYLCRGAEEMDGLKSGFVDGKCLFREEGSRPFQIFQNFFYVKQSQLLCSSDTAESKLGSFLFRQSCKGICIHCHGGRDLSESAEHGLQLGGLGFPLRQAGSFLFYNGSRSAVDE